MIQQVQLSNGDSGAIAARRIAPPGATRLLASRFLSREEREALTDAMSPPRWVQPRVDLVRQGDRTDNIFLFTQGWACRYMSTDAGELHYPALLVAGDVGNLDTLMFDQLDYGIRTITKSAVTSLPRGRALTLADRHPGIARTFTWLAVVENSLLSQASMSLGRRSAREALAHLICELHVRLGLPEEDASSFDFPMTQEQVSYTLGLTPVHVNRIMRSLHRDGAIVATRSSVSIPSMKRLRDIACFNPQYLQVSDQVATA